MDETIEPSLAGALLRQESELAPRMPRIDAFMEAVGKPGDLTRHQWVGLMAMVLDFRPDLVVELGRGFGNSTCAFTEIAHTLGDCRVVSLCVSDSWESHTVPRLQAIVDPEWFAPLTALTTDILTFDFATLLKSARRVFVFWDAHGFAVAECVLGGVLPLLMAKPHLVALHDIQDARYIDPSLSSYRGERLWRGNDWSGPFLRLGHLQSSVEQAISVVDFTSRNNLTLHTATHSIRTGMSPDELKAVDERLGVDLSALESGWVYFTLNGSKGPWYFPRRGRLSLSAEARDGLTRAWQSVKLWLQGFTALRAILRRLRPRSE